jgi:putative transposase
MLKAYRYRLYPNKEQEIQLNKTFGCVRFIYNKMLADRIEYYKETGKGLNNTPAQYKSEYIWLKEIDSLALANAQLNLNKAYQNFFREIKKGNKTGFPKFKSKKNNNYSYTTNNQNRTIEIIDNYIKLPKFKTMIKFVKHREFEGMIKSATISKKPSGKYFISILVETEIEQLPINKNKIGIDLGIKDFAICSNGDKFENPKWLRKSEKRLIKLQKDLSRKQKGSNNRNKQRIKVAKLYEKITNQRKDFLQKISSNIISENQVIVIEDLQVKNMIKNEKLAKSISEVSWGEFRIFLDYKAKWYGRQLIIAPKHYASSQLCSVCEYKNSNTKDLSVREWECPQCHTTHDRDINAANNLLKLAI